MYSERGKRRTRSQGSSRHVSSSEDESTDMSTGLFTNLIRDDEDAFYEDCEGAEIGDDDDILHDRRTRLSSGERSNKTLSDGSFTSYMQHGFLTDVPEPSERDAIPSEVLESERDFMKYVMSLPPEPSEKPPEMQLMKSSSNKVGLDHLDNLCKLLEQLGDLKERNQKLERRVEYLEGLRMLHDMYKDTTAAKESPVEKEVVEPEVAAHQHSGSSYRKNKSSAGRLKYKMRAGQSRSARNRSKSVGTEEIKASRSSKSKASKWTKMKEVLGIEKSTCNLDVELRVTDGIQKSHTTDLVYRRHRKSAVKDNRESMPLAPPPEYRTCGNGSEVSRPESMLSDDSSVPEETELKIKEELDRLSVSPVFQGYNQGMSKLLIWFLFCKACI